MINDFYYQTIDILEKQVNASEVRFVIRGIKTENGLLIDKDGDTEISIDKSAYKELVEEFDKSKSRMELVFNWEIV
jgi:hypothetical protein